MKAVAAFALCLLLLAGSARAESTSPRDKLNAAALAFLSEKHLKARQTGCATQPCLAFAQALGQCVQQSPGDALAGYKCACANPSGFTACVSTCSELDFDSIDDFNKACAEFTSNSASIASVLSTINSILSSLASRTTAVVTTTTAATQTAQATTTAGPTATAVTTSRPAAAGKLGAGVVAVAAFAGVAGVFAAL